MKEKVVLAYSGGLDTTAIIPWLKETYDYEVVCCCINCGQGEELDGLEERAKLSGASKLYIEDIVDEFCEDYIIPCVQAGAVYEHKYLLGTSMARPGIAKKLVEVARKEVEVGSGRVEAKPRHGVCVTPIDTFMAEATPKGGAHPLVVVGRLRNRCGVARSVANALKYVGRPYDYLFMHDDQELYCSELVMLSYVDCAGSPVFAPIRMSFHDDSGQVTQFWRDYYAKRGLRVPEGAQGSNPGQLSRDPKLTIVYRYF